MADISKKKQRPKERNRGTIFIGRVIHQWDEIKTENLLNTNTEVAEFLIDIYYRSIKKGEERHSNTSTASEMYPVGSTPVSSKKKRKLGLVWPLISDISSGGDCSEERLPQIGISSRSSATLSGETDHILDVTGLSETVKLQLKGNQRQAKQKEFTKSCVDPLQLSISTYEEEYDNSDIENDPDYKPYINMYIGPSDANHLPETSFDNVVYDFDDDRGIDEDEDEESILLLAKISINKCNHGDCVGTVDITSKFIGSALYLNWICTNGHKVYRWCSQPTIKFGLHSGDLLMSTCILLSGNNYYKISLLAKMLNLGIVSKDTFFQIQRHYLVPCIEKFWKEHEEQIYKEFKDKDITILGDGRMDSPGFCAQYCSYIFMENITKKVVSIETMDKRQVCRKSVNMEKASFQNGLNKLIQKMNITEVVTDAHVGIAALMRNEYSNIKHSHDIWHAAMNIGKKIIEAGNTKDTKDLLPWVHKIQNHFWYAAEQASTYSEFLNIWYGVKHHVCDQHEWLIPQGDGPAHCRHSPINDADTTRATPLKPGSKSSMKLNEVVMNPRLMNKVPYYLNNRSTSDIENFNQLILMYAGKRFSYTPPVYNARNILAALDHNYHIDRADQLNATGKKRYHRVYNKKSSRWTVVTAKEAKTYTYIPELIKTIILARLKDTESLRRKKEITDIRAIEKHLAPIPPPSTTDLVKLKVSRLET